MVKTTAHSSAPKEERGRIMSTRANIIVKDKYSELWFYRHSDGYPEGAMPLLEKFMDAVKEGTIRDNTGQASGWLILLGAEEYGVKADFTRPTPEYRGGGREKDWKVGAIEPTRGQHEDIEFLYTLDLEKKTITTEAV